MQGEPLVGYAEPRSVVRSALIRFTILSVLALALLSVTTVVVSGQIAREEAVHDARTRSVGMARGIAAPLVSDEVRRRDPEAMRTLTQALENRMRDGSVSHIVLWGLDGRILWADDKNVVGRVFALPSELRDLARRRESLLVEPGERAPHPGRESGDETLIEVYVGAVDAGGEPFLFEAYLPPEGIEEESRAVLRLLLPPSLGTLLMLELAALALALSLARRIDRSTRQRARILRGALGAWHEERHRLAEELHDGVIQDLSAMGYALPAVLEQLPHGPSTDRARAAGTQMSELLVQDLGALRSMVLDLVPTRFDGAGLMSALDALVHKAGEGGLRVALSMDRDLRVSEMVGGLVYRTVREGLRNVEKHAGAQSAQVHVTLDDGCVRVAILDDGDGVGPITTETGHVGLSLLAQLVGDIGGSLELVDGPEGGSALRIVIPTGLEDP